MFSFDKMFDYDRDGELSAAERNEQYLYEEEMARRNSSYDEEETRHSYSVNYDIVDDDYSTYEDYSAHEDRSYSFYVSEPMAEEEEHVEEDVFSEIGFSRDELAYMTSDDIVDLLDEAGLNLDDVEVSDILEECGFDIDEIREAMDDDFDDGDDFDDIDDFDF